MLHKIQALCNDLQRKDKENRRVQSLFWCQGQLNDLFNAGERALLRKMIEACMPPGYHNYSHWLLHEDRTVDDVLGVLLHVEMLHSQLLLEGFHD